VRQRAIRWAKGGTIGLRDFLDNSAGHWNRVAITPPRSRLYHLAPVGIGTGLVESLTGYSSRLAVAHNVTLAVLFGYEIAHLLDKNHLRNSEKRSNKNAVLSNSFRALAPAVDGRGIIAETYIDALQKLTTRDDLRFLTMLPWKDVISHRHLIRPNRAWCPTCYHEWQAGATVYQPLVWSLDVVTICIRHHQRLQSKCPSCKRDIRPLASRSSPGYCPSCHAWLGQPTQTGLQHDENLVGYEVEWQRWVNQQISEMLTVTPALTTSLQRSVMAGSISRSIRGSVFKSELSFARQCGLAQSSMNSLCRGDSVPQLSTLLKISFFTRVPVVDLLLGRPPNAFGVQTRTSLNHVPKTGKPAALSQRWSRNKTKTIRRLFEELAKATPPLSMVEIRKRLSHPATSLRSKFPELCQKTVVRYREHVKNNREEFWESVRERLQKQLTQKPPYSVAEVAREVARSRPAVVKRFPELCTKLSEHWSQCRNEHWDTIEASLHNSLECGSPSHLRDIAKQLNVSHTSLYEYFPQLCHKIADRYALQLQQSRAAKKEALRNEVRRIARCLWGKGIYPSVRKVEKYLTKPRSLRTSQVALVALREVRHELDLASCHKSSE